MSSSYRPHESSSTHHRSSSLSSPTMTSAAAQQQQHTSSAPPNPSVAAANQRRTSYDDDTRRPRPEVSGSKADQIVQHFYSKTCTIVSQARMTHLTLPNSDDPSGSGGANSPSASTSSGNVTRRGMSPTAGTTRRSSTTVDRAKSVHKWFNIELADSDIFRNELRTWRSVSSLLSQSASPSSSTPPPISPNSPNARTPVPPMILDILLDTKEMMPNQVLVVSDERGRRVRVDPSFAIRNNDRRISNPTSLPSSGMRSPLAVPSTGSNRSTAAPSTVVLERWNLSIVPNSTMGQALNLNDLPAVYKRAIIHFRTLFSTTRILPSWNLHRRLVRRRAGNGVVGGGGLMIGMRMSMSEAEVENSEGREGEVALGTPISEVGEENVVETIVFPVILTPLGGLKLTCTYRLNAEFAVEDIETLLSSRFIDEDFFKPTMARYQQEAAISSGRVGSLPAGQKHAIVSPSTSPPMTGLAPKPSYGSLSSRHHLTSPPPLLSTATTSTSIPSSSAAVPIARASTDNRPGASSSSPVREGSASSSGRMSAYGSSASASGHTVEPAFLSLSRARGASYTSQIQRASASPASAQQIVGSSVPRRPSFTASGSSPISGSPIFRASSYLSSPPSALSSSPSTGPTSNIHRVGSQTSNSPSSLGLGFARQQQQTVLAVTTTSSGGSSPGTVTTGTTPMTMVARSPLSGATAPRPIPSPSSGGIIPRYSTSGGSYSRSYGRGSSGGGSFGSITGPAGGQLGEAPWPESLNRRPSSSSAYHARSITVPEEDPKKFLTGVEDDSDDINAFLGMIDSKPELMKASMMGSSTASTRAEQLNTKTRVDEQLKALRGSVYSNLGGTAVGVSTGASPPMTGFGPATTTPQAGLGLSSPTGAFVTRTTSLGGLRKQTSRLSIEEEPSLVPTDRRSVSDAAPKMPRTRPSEISSTSTQATNPISFPHYISPRTRAVASTAVTTTGFELPSSTTASRPESITTATPPQTGHSSVTSFASTRSGFAPEEEAVGRLELGDPDDEEEDGQETVDEEGTGRNRGRQSTTTQTNFRDLSRTNEGGRSSRDPTPGAGMVFNRRQQTDYFSVKGKEAEVEQEEEEEDDRSPGEVPWMD